MILNTGCLRGWRGRCPVHTDEMHEYPAKYGPLDGYELAKSLRAKHPKDVGIAWRLARAAYNVAGVLKWVGWCLMSYNTAHPRLPHRSIQHARTVSNA